jgi:hypothetical protein
MINHCFFGRNMAYSAIFISASLLAALGLHAQVETAESRVPLSIFGST